MYNLNMTTACLPWAMSVKCRWRQVCFVTQIKVEKCVVLREVFTYWSYGQCFANLYRFYQCTQFFTVKEYTTNKIHFTSLLLRKMLLTMLPWEKNPITKIQSENQTIFQYLKRRRYQGKYFSLTLILACDRNSVF